MDNRIRDKMGKEEKSPIKKGDKIMKVGKTKKNIPSNLSKYEEVVRRLIEIAERSKIDPRKLLAVALYYCPGSESCGKMIKSCEIAGYQEDYARTDRRNILGLDRVKDTMYPALEFRGFTPQMVSDSYWKIVAKGLTDDSQPKDREIARKTLDKVMERMHGKVPEVMIQAKKEEKHVFHHYDSKDELIKYYDEVIKLAKGEKERVTEEKEG